MSLSGYLHKDVLHIDDLTFLLKRAQNYIQNPMLLTSPCSTLLTCPWTWSPHLLWLVLWTRGWDTYLNNITRWWHILSDPILLLPESMSQMNPLQCIQICLRLHFVEVNTYKYIPIVYIYIYIYMHIPSINMCCVCWAQSHLTLCDRLDCSPPGSSVHGIF